MIDVLPSSKTTLSVVLIDYENVPLEILPVFDKHQYRVFVFLGPDHQKLPTEFVAAMQDLGNSSRYIRLHRKGKNALDFLISYYVGVLSTGFPDAKYVIISKDAGYDPLIEYLSKQKISISRRKSLKGLCVRQQKVETPRRIQGLAKETEFDKVIRCLKESKKSRPAQLSTLSNWINAHTLGKLKDEEIAKIVQQLKSRKFIQERNGKITYPGCERNGTGVPGAFGRASSREAGQ